MKKEIQIEGLGFLEYEESLWTGKSILRVDGKTATKGKKRTFTIDGKTVVVSGTFFSGITARYNDRTYVISERMKWYEYVLAVLPFIFCMVWGTSEELCSIFPIVGGAIGGGICGAMIVVQMAILSYVKKAWEKLLAGVALGVATVFILHMVGILLLMI